MFRIRAIVRTSARLLRPAVATTTRFSLAFKPTTAFQSMRAGHGSMGALHTSARMQACQSETPSEHPLLTKLKANPHILHKLAGFTAFLEAKGIDMSGEQPSMMQVAKVMSDTEVREKIKDLVKDMQEAEIELDMSTISELQASLGEWTKEVDDGKKDKN
ncbi:hypothetical protein J3Q64DRAFT_1650930 [Phycomyces blakesleeanus]|uniref:Uncharacterized protein n=2 Tax=Phycomyces blakesleeanus TaxID=4837 RepID=A0A167P5X6_PHYB8|nr:hypothetical protein PHYBLDRAFT_157724 [Phycomyces blakesleeanus NRRL 1555(-)]OAD77308.1 hypothetical protein PHYBLDRAFT_157724 [Phycomyces blakesleeanus NRRL 1555(-)]|eukprot:XP_018295348.1 hypothetical protein PHYBLDRAFT_157724 [Phycomyces blakesleeanus NRRL 1555(-)]